MNLIGTATSKLVALVLLVGLLFLAGLLFRQPVDRLQELREEAATARARLNVIERTAAQTVDPELEKRLLTRFERFYLPPTARGTQAANFQEQFRTFAANSAVNILQIAETADNVQDREASRDAVTLRVSISGESGGLIRFFQSMEQSRPWIRMDNVTLRRSLVSSVDAQTEPPLEAEFDATAYVANEERQP